MDLNNYGLEKFRAVQDLNKYGLKKINEKSKSEQKDKLKEAAEEFTAIFFQKMFESMRDTLPEDKLLDGGFAEDVFTDTLDSEISKLGAAGNSFNSLKNMLYLQLRQEMDGG